MNKLELLKSIDFGKSVAELEADNLKYYFLAEIGTDHDKL